MKLSSLSLKGLVVLLLSIGLFPMRLSYAYQNVHEAQVVVIDSQQSLKDRILNFLYQYNPETKKEEFILVRMMRGTTGMVAFGIGLLLLSFRCKKKAKKWLRQK